MSLDPTTCALLVIDAIDACGDDGVYAIDQSARAVREAAALCVKACRSHGIPVIRCEDAHRVGSDRELELWGNHGIVGQTRLWPEIGEDTSDLIIPKRRYSGFFGTDLDLTLRELGVTSVIAIGCDTNICVLHTLADAFFLGYHSVLIHDATRTFLVGTQEGAEEHCRVCFGTRVLTTQELLTQLEGSHSVDTKNILPEDV